VRLTIERIRTLVLAAGVLLVVVLAVFLAIGKWKAPFSHRDIPNRLGIGIQNDASGVTYTQAHGGYTLFKIHASRVVQFENNHATLHDVVIELYGKDGSTDRIKGDQFEYDQKAQVATAAGPVEITLMRLATTPEAGAKVKAKPAAAEDDQIHVKTSGLVFDQKTGVASTDQRVDFSSMQGSGTAIGASYDSNRGLLVLYRAVELTTQRGANPVQVHAEHAEIDRIARVSNLRGAVAHTRDEQATASVAQINFREDGSVTHLDASGGLTVSTAAGNRIEAPHGWLDFNQNNQPQRGRLEGGVKLASSAPGRTMTGASPTMDLTFNSVGELRHTHLEQGVEMESHEEGQSNANGREVPVEIKRTWRSPVADVDFRTAGEGRIEPAEVHGTGGVVITGETRRANAAPTPSRLAADDVRGVFGSNSMLTTMTGTGHASLDETTATGARNTASGDRLRADFAAAQAPGSSLAHGEQHGKNSRVNPAGNAAGGNASQPAQIQSAELEGNVTLIQVPATKPGATPQPPLKAVAGRAVYEAAGQWLHLTVNPRVNDGGMELTADRLDVSQESGDAFAHGNVKATWLDTGGANASGAANLGGKGPAHMVAAEAQLHQPTGEATFRGQARLWQQDNSVNAPLIVIDRQKQTLVAKTTNPSDPVITVLLSATQSTNHASSKASQTGAPSVVRVRGGDLWYSETERKAVMRAAPLTAVTAQSNGVESASEQVELYLTPAGAARPAAGNAAAAQVERMNAVGHVVLTSQDRRGTGEKLAYTGQSGEYVLTGTPSAAPRLTDPQRGSVTGSALIFNSRNDSVSIEGAGRQTTTETTAPK
jgi:lipopolysaccharide export system protein LptA